MADSDMRNMDAMHNAFSSFVGHTAYLFLSFSFSLLNWREVGGLISSPAMICRELSTRTFPNPRLEIMDTSPMSKLNHPLQTEQ